LRRSQDRPEKSGGGEKSEANYITRPPFSFKGRVFAPIENDIACYQTSNPNNEIEEGEKDQSCIVIHILSLRELGGFSIACKRIAS
jgi:hypothetical protein